MRWQSVFPAYAGVIPLDVRLIGACSGIPRVCGGDPGLTQKFATAEEEWDDMALDKAARVMVSLSRTKVYKDKVKQELKTKMELAFEQMEADLMKLIKDDPQLSKSLKEVLEQAKEKMMRDD